MLVIQFPISKDMKEFVQYRRNFSRLPDSLFFKTIK